MNNIVLFSSDSPRKEEQAYADNGKTNEELSCLFVSVGSTEVHAIRETELNTLYFL